MTRDDAPRPPRRPRYRGKHPQRFQDKYKEHDPARFGSTIAKVIASGKTPAGSHLPVMVAECLAALRLAPGMTGVDATLGYGGHALHLLAAITPGGKLIGLDQDPLELPKTIARIRQAGFDEHHFAAVRSNYAGLLKVLDERAPGGVDFILADLGCSSMQLDDPARGFTFKADGPLDMRMNPQRGIPAATWLARATPDQLATALHQNADEPHADILAAALAGRQFASTLELATAVRAAIPMPPATVELTVRRLFQALRIAVNEEFVALDAFLRVLPLALKPGARAAILTFHSGEDRRVKHAFRAGLRNGQFRAISQEIITATPEERRLNPRSAPAKLRWAERA